MTNYIKNNMLNVNKKYTNNETRIKDFYYYKDLFKKVALNIKKKEHIIITGLHRSCTSILFKTIKKSKLVSGHNNTNLPEDEAIWLQNIYPGPDDIGNPSNFCFNKEYNFNENSDFLLLQNKILYQWANHWDISKKILVQKSPSHIMHTRFIQKMLPNSYIILIKRHPVFYYYSLSKWNNDYKFEDLIRHWIAAHNIFNNDKKYLKNVLEIKSEDFIKDPENEINRINNLLNNNLNINDISDINKNSNLKYINQWRKEKAKYKLYIDKYEKYINEHGYSFNI